MWLPIPGYQNRYEVSDEGQVRSLIYGKVRILRPVTLKRGGYQQVQLYPYQGSKQHGHKVHYLVMLAFVGPRPDGLEVLHGDGNPANNHLSNLRYGTAGSNQRDSVSHGTHNMASKTHCKRGHPFDEKNTYHIKSGGRACRECWRLRAAGLI